MENLPEWFIKRYKQAQPDIKIIQDAGYKVIGYSVMILEDTYYLETKELALKAFDEIEKGKKGPQGWWYGIEEREKCEQEYKDKCNETPCYIQVN